jgi:PhnB protein
MSAKATKALEDFHTITPHLTVRGVSEAVNFYEKAFGAAELYRNLAPDGKSVMHVELALGDSRLLLHDEFPEHGQISPLGGQVTGVVLHLYVDDVDDIYQRTVEAGAKIVMPLQDCFWGDRYAIVVDPFGHRWSMATRIEDLSPRQLKERGKEFNAQHPEWTASREDDGVARPGPDSRANEEAGRGHDL